MKPLLVKERNQLLLLVACYTVCLFALAYRRFFVFGYDTTDIGNFSDMFWWAFRGKPFFHATRGFSNFGIHAAFLWVQLFPIMGLHPSVTVLIFLQSLFIGVAGIPMYLIVRHVMQDHKTALIMTLAFLLFPPIVSQHVNQVEEPSFVAVYLLFTFYFFLIERFRLFLLFALIACLGRENVPLAIAMFGLYALVLRRSWQWVLAPIVLGGGYFVVVMFVVMPYFRQGIPWDATSRMFSYLGNDTGSILTNTLSHPGLVLQHIFGGENINYLILLLQPAGWILPLTSPVVLMALPDLAINLLSDNGALKVIGWHYNVITGSFLFVGAVFTLRTIANRLKQGVTDWRCEQCFAVSLLVLSIAHWFLWFSPGQYRELPEHDALVHAIQAVPSDKSVLVPLPLQGHICGREHWNFIGAFQINQAYSTQFEYVILDANERRFAPVITQKFFDFFANNSGYRLVFNENNVFVFHRLGGESDWKILTKDIANGPVVTQER